MTIIEETIKLLSEMNEPIHNIGEIETTFEWEGWKVYAVARTISTYDGATKNLYFLMKKGNVSKIADTKEARNFSDYID